MGGVWCKSDKGQRSYSPKGPFNTTISRWTDHVRHAYRKQKTHHRPPRPPQKPARSNERLTISAPTLVTEASSDGWRTATLIVPESAPVPPPRKKRKKNRDLTRSAVSMDDLNHRSMDSLCKSTLSLPDKCHSDTLDSRSFSSTLVVTPILESREKHNTDHSDDYNKENIKTNLKNKIEEVDEDEDEIDATDQPDIIPIERNTLFSCRTLLHSNLGYIDKLSAISEVSAESGFDDKTDFLKSSEGSGSVTSVESVHRETGLNILAHIHNINNVSQLKENNVDMREKTAVSKKEWLQNILKEDPEPYFISRDTSKEYRRGSEGLTKSTITEDTSGQPNSLPIAHLHIMNVESEPSVVGSVENKPPLSTFRIDHSPENDNNHSVLLGIIQKSNEAENETNTPNIFDHKEETIFLTNTKTNIIYKSLSSDKLTDDYDTNYTDVIRKDAIQCNSSLNKSTENSLKSESENGRHFSLDSTNPFNSSTSETHLSDYSFQTPKLVVSDSGLNSILEDKRSNVVSSFGFKEIKESHNYVTALQDLQPTVNKESSETNKKSGDISLPNEHDKTKTNENKNNSITKDTLTKRDSISSSRRSSITDSLHEFEMSIYDMLKESKKHENSSDEDDSLKTVK